VNQTLNASKWSLRFVYSFARPLIFNKLFINFQEGHKLMREFLERAKNVIGEKGADSEEMKQLRQEVQDSSNPFIKNLLNVL